MILLVRAIRKAVALTNVSRSSFQILAARVARATLLGKDNTAIRGTVWVFYDRLVLRVLLVHIIDSLLISQLVFAVAMLFTLPKIGLYLWILILLANLLFSSRKAAI